MENVECFADVVQRHNMMLDAARNAIHIAGAENAIFVAQKEVSLSFDDHPDLLVRMRVWLHDGIRLKGDEAQHHLAAGCRLNLNSRENIVLRSGISFDEIL